MGDGVDSIITQWAREKPDLDVSPMAVIGRLSRAAVAVHQRLAATYSELDMDASTFDVLATLLRSGAPHALTPGALADSAMLTSSAIAQRVNRLVARGLVERSGHPGDRRQTLVHLTADGHDLIERALPRHLETEQEILVTLSASERALAATLLQRIFDASAPPQALAEVPTTPR